MEKGLYSPHHFDIINPMKKWTKDEIKAKLESDNEWLIRGLLAIHSRQTEDEQNSEMTKEDNGIGFNAFDAAILTDFVNQYNTAKFLSKRQIILVRKKMLKYAGQLTRIANKEV